MENAEELKELKARLLAVVAAYKEFTAGNTKKEEDFIPPPPKADGNHYFNIDGKFLSCDDMDGEQSILILSKQGAKPTLFTQTALSHKAIANIHNFYFSDKKYGMGENLSFLWNKSVVVANTAQTVYNKHPKFNARGSGEMSAWTEGKDKLLIVPVSGNKLDSSSSTSDNYVNLINIMVHELHHLKNDVGLTNLTLDDVRHLNAYFAQINDETFANSTPEYQKSIMQRVGMLLGHVKLWAMALNRKDLHNIYKTNKIFIEKKYNVKFENLENIIEIQADFANNPPYGNNTSEISKIAFSGLKVNFLNPQPPKPPKRA